jgi:aspartyl-tRNA(Asn)/glutamyl-tRNA(Gln) amidotransferase subunit A
MLSLDHLRPTLRDIAAGLRDGSMTSVGLMRELITRADRLHPALGAYQLRFDESALSAAAAADDELSSGRDRGPLHGIPIAIKGIIAVAEGPTTAGSLIHDPAWAGRATLPWSAVYATPER